VAIYSEILPSPKTFRIVPDLDSCIVMDMILLATLLFETGFDGCTPPFISTGRNRKNKDKTKA